MESVGLSKAKCIVIQLMAQALRQGKRPKVMGTVANDVLFGNINPVDAEVLARLRVINES